MQFVASGTRSWSWRTACLALLLPISAWSANSFVRGTRGVDPVAIRRALARGVRPAEIAESIAQAARGDATTLAVYLSTLLRETDERDLHPVAIDFMRRALRVDPGAAGPLSETFLRAAPPEQSEELTRALVRAVPGAEAAIRQAARRVAASPPPSDDELDGYLQVFLSHLAPPEEAIQEGGLSREITRKLEEDALAYVETLYQGRPDLAGFLVQDLVTVAPFLHQRLFSQARRFLPPSDHSGLQDLQEEVEERLARVETYLSTPPEEPDPPMEYLDAPFLQALEGGGVRIGHEELEPARDVATLASQVRLLDGFARTCLIGDYLVEHLESLIPVSETLAAADPDYAEQVFTVALEVAPEREREIQEAAERFGASLERVLEAVDQVSQGAPLQGVLSSLADSEVELFQNLTTLKEAGL